MTRNLLFLLVLITASLPTAAAARGQFPGNLGQIGGGLGGGLGGSLGSGGSVGGGQGGANQGIGSGPTGATPAPQIDSTQAFSEIQRDSGPGATAGEGAKFGEDRGQPAVTPGGIGGGMRGFGGVGGMGRMSESRSSGSSLAPPVLRTRLRSAVQYQPRPTWQQQQQVGSRLRTLASQRQLSGMNVSVEGQTATLSGRVNSEHDRRISQLLISLEPGIRRVENRLIVQP